MMFAFMLVKIAVCVCFLVWASVADFRCREVSNSVWRVFIPLGLVLTLVELGFSGFPLDVCVLVLVSVAVSAAVFVGLFYLGFFGGADAKALLGLAVCLPLPPDLFGPFFGFVLPFFPLSVFDNSVVFSVLVLPAALISNVVWKVRWRSGFFEGFEGEPLWRKVGALIFCFKVRSSEVKPYDSVAEEALVLPGGVVKRRIVVFRRVGDLGGGGVGLGELPPHVFVHFTLPMVVFITAGFVAALFVGDIVFSAVSWMLGAI
jgi:preflagellin peptidase FlaK